MHQGAVKVGDDNIKAARFYRDFRRYTGGHQKVYDYFRHVQAHPDWQASIYWAKSSLPISETLWAGQSANLLEDFSLRGADLMFLAGMDWEAYLAAAADPEIPVLNLVQHVRHADPASNVYPFLSERAIRVCVSAEVEAAILATGRTNGPTVTIANGIDLDDLLLQRQALKSRDIYILGVKSRELARRLTEQLQAQPVSVLLHDEFTERADVLAAMASCRVSVLLPNLTEGFYLPALEAMALSELVVVPDCVGNRSFCLHGQNCLVPGRALDDLVAATLEALEIVKSGQAVEFQASAASTLEQHRLERERSEFHQLLDKLDTLW